MAYNSRRNKNATSALGRPGAQATVYGVWFAGILTGAALLALFVLLVSPPYQGRTQQTARENGGQNFSQIVTTQDGTKIAYVEAWKTQGDQGQKELRAALSRGQTNYGRICIGCHYGPPRDSSNGPYLGDLYQTPTLYNGTPLNDANLVRFILQGHGNMPAGIPLAEQAVDIMLYLKQQTCGKNPCDK